MQHSESMLKIMKRIRVNAIIFLNYNQKLKKSLFFQVEQSNVVGKQEHLPNEAIFAIRIVDVNDIQVKVIELIDIPFI